MPSSKAEFWKRLDDLFNQSVDLDSQARKSFIEDHCAGDPEMRDELESLLKCAGATGDVLESIVHGAAHDVWTVGSSKLLESGGRFARFVIVSRLGAGGMGQVYLAEDPQLRRKVALKTLLPEVAADQEMVQRFKHEALAASALNHPNILTIHEVGEHGGTHFIVSEYVDGQTVRDKLRDGKFPVQQAVDIAIQIAAGLEAAHAAGITHRDIKPENVIVRNDGLVKLVDFGIARMIEERPGRAPLPDRLSITSGFKTKPGILIGTAKYMSPEQARGRELDARTDLFSLGAVMYEMLCGRAPFEGSSDSELIAEVIKTDPRPLHEVEPAVAVALSRVVAKSMSKDRELRYRSASELLTDLRMYREKSESQARLNTSKHGLRHWRWRNAAALLVALAAVLGGGAYEWRNLIGNSSSRRPQSLAILPFRNIKQDPATDFLGYSLADAVITKMGYVNSIIVRPSSSIDRYRNQIIDPRKVAAELNVDALLTGSFVKDGDDLRINTQLIDARHVSILWRDTIDVKYEKLLTVQDRVAQQIIAGLALNLSPVEAGHLKLDNPTNASAYESYLRGVDLYALNDFSNAIDELEKSARMNPGYALTWAHLGRAYATNASLQFGGRQQYRTALEAYRRAIQLNPALIEPRVYMANLFTDTGRVEDAVPLLRTALSENENSAEAHWELGYAYRFGGLLRESATESERARQLDPKVKINSSALNTFLYLGEYDKFLASLPVHDSAYIVFYRGFGDYYKKDFARAANYFDHAFDLDGSLLQANVGKALADGIRHGQRAGLDLLGKTEKRIRETGLSDAEGIYKVSQAYAVLGDSNSSLRLLKATIEGGFFPYPYLRTDPLTASLHGNRQFDELMKRAQDRHKEFSRRFSSAAQ